MGEQIISQKISQILEHISSHMEVQITEQISLQTFEHTAVGHLPISPKLSIENNCLFLYFLIVRVCSISEKLI